VSVPTVSSGAVEIKHLFEDTPLHCRFCRTRVVDIAQKFDRTRVRSRLFEETVEEEGMTAPARTLIVIHPERSARVPGIGLTDPPASGPTRSSGPGRPAQLRRPSVVPRGSALPDRGETARRRAVQAVIAGVVTLTVVCGLAVLGQAAASGPAVPFTTVPAATAVVQVGAGETVWDVARRVAPDAATPAVVQRIRELNGMAGSELRPGERLTVPDGR